MRSKNCLTSSMLEPGSRHSARSVFTSEQVRHAIQKARMHPCSAWRLKTITFLRCGRAQRARAPMQDTGRQKTSGSNSCPESRVDDARYE